jgi:hypothetical protein
VRTVHVPVSVSARRSVTLLIRPLHQSLGCFEVDTAENILAQVRLRCSTAVSKPRDSSRNLLFRYGTGLIAPHHERTGVLS